MAIALYIILMTFSLMYVDQNVEPRCQRNARQLTTAAMELQLHMYMRMYIAIHMYIAVASG